MNTHVSTKPSNKPRKTISISKDALRVSRDLKRVHNRSFSNLIEYLIEQEAARTRKSANA